MPNRLQDFQSYSAKLFCEVNSRALLPGSWREKGLVAWKHYFFLMDWDFPTPELMYYNF